MPRAAAKETKPSPFENIHWGRFTFWLTTGAIAMVFALWVWHRTEAFLIQDDRFRLADADDVAGQSPSLSVQGVHYASPAQIRHVFADDFGRSLYLVPIQERRHQLLAIDWVEEASVSKIWPNSVRVSIAERKPVAFVPLPDPRRNGVSQLALIDRDGLILRPRRAARFTLPVIAGVHETQTQAERRLRVRRVLAMFDALGPLADGIAEVNASDPDNLVLEERIDGGIVNLMIGDENYAERLKNLLEHYDQIKAKRPDAKLLDLRVDGVITAAGGNAIGG